MRARAEVHGSRNGIVPSDTGEFIFDTGATGPAPPPQPGANKSENNAIALKVQRNFGVKVMLALVYKYRVRPLRVEWF